MKATVRAQSTPAFVRNSTRDVILAETGGILRNPLRQAVGTMFHRLPGAYVFVLPWKTHVAITNLFVFQPLDILWLEDDGSIVDIREHFPPFALHAGPLRVARYVVELPGGSVAASGTRIGDRLAITGLAFREAPPPQRAPQGRAQPPVRGRKPTVGGRRR